MARVGHLDMFCFCELENEGDLVFELLAESFARRFIP